MVYTIEKSALYDLLQRVYPLVPLKSSLQTLSNIKMVLSADQIEISATDLDHSIKTTDLLAGSGSQVQEITVNAKKIIEIVRELHDGPVNLSFDENVLIIESGGSFSCKIACSDSLDFPQFPILENVQQFKVPSKKLKNMVGKSSFAVSRDELKACLCGVLWEVFPEKTGMIATDGHRLGSVFYSENYGVADRIATIIPPKTLVHLVKIISDEKEDAEIAVSVAEKYILFNTATTVLCSKCIDGPYPDYEKVIPKNNPKSAVMNRIDLQNAVRRVSVLSNQKTHLVKFIFSENELEIMVINRDIGGEAKQKIGIEYSGEEHTIGFNATYFSEILSMISTEKVKIEMNTQISACLLFPYPDKEQVSICQETFLIMPLRIMDERASE